MRQRGRLNRRGVRGHGEEPRESEGAARLAAALEVAVARSDIGAMAAAAGVDLEPLERHRRDRTARLDA